MKILSLLAIGIGLAITPLASAADPAASPTPPSKHPKKEKGGHCKGPGEQGRPHGMGGRLAEKLNLTDAQKAQVKSIMESKHPQIQQIREEERAKMKVVMDDAKTQIRAILTPEQIKTLDEMEQAHKDRKDKKAGE